jgi:DNA repair photolyase
VTNDSLRGRGAANNPDNRFVPLRYEPDPDAPPGEREFRSEVYRDVSKSILSRNDSPDVPFEWSVNPYRGCEHGCIYCYARPTHEYFGLSAGLDFETKLFVKENAPELLRAELMNPKWQPAPIVFSGVTDCYQPIERSFRLTRRCLEVLAEFGNPAGVITKNALIERDLDVLQGLARHDLASVAITITTLDETLAAKLEPRAATPRRRLATIAALAGGGVPVHVMTPPVIPGLTDHELPALLRAAADAGASSANYTLLRLPHAVDPLFDDWLARAVPGQRDKVLRRIEDARGGKRYDPNFATRMRGEGRIADEIGELFAFAKERAGLTARPRPLALDRFRRPGPQQRSLW